MNVSVNSELRRIAVLAAVFSTAFLSPASATKGEPPVVESATQPALTNGSVSATGEAAQTGIISSADIDDSIARRVAVEKSQRDDVDRLLQRAEVARIAAASGIDLDRARSKAATLSGAELEALAARASHAQAQLAGGDTIVISATAIIIILLILILLTD